MRPQDLVLAATSSAGLSYERVFHGNWHGAFTWAVTSVLGRWMRSPTGDGGAVIDLSYQHLAERAAALLEALAIDQPPVLEVSPKLRDIPLFAPLDGDEPVAPATGKVEMQQDSKEIDGGIEYILYDIYDTSTKKKRLGYLMVTGPNWSGTVHGQTWEANKEYWIWTSSSYSDTNWPSRFYLFLNSGDPTLSTTGTEWPSANFSGSAPNTTLPSGYYRVEYSTATSTSQCYIHNKSSNHRIWYRKNGTGLLSIQGSQYMDFKERTDTKNVKGLPFVDVTN